MEPITVFTIAGALILLLLIVGAPLKPLQFIGQGITKVMIGALFLFFLNTFGSSFGLHVPINPVTATVAGLLGIPGVGALAAIKLFVLV